MGGRGGARGASPRGAGGPSGRGRGASASASMLPPQAAQSYGTEAYEYVRAARTAFLYECALISLCVIVLYVHACCIIVTW